MTRQRYRYDIRYFRIEDHGFHECTGNVVSVLQSAYNVARKTWYLTVLVQRPAEEDDNIPEGWGGNGGSDSEQDA